MFYSKKLKPFLFTSFTYFLALAVVVSSSKVEDKQVEVLACNHEEAQFKCPPGRIIKIERANFGRFSSRTCRSTEQQEAALLLGSKDTCSNPETIDVLKKKCDGLDECNVFATTSIFGSVCEDKIDPYLDASYRCEAEPTTTTTTTTVAPSTESASLEDKDVKIGVAGPNRPETTRKSVSYCPKKIHNSVEYPRTVAGTTTTQGCTEGAKGSSEWSCNANGAWIGDYPDTRNCISDWTLSIRHRLTTVKNDADAPGLADLFRELAEHTRRPMQAGDLQSINVLLTEAVYVMINSEWTNEIRNICHEKLVESVNYISRSSGIWSFYPVKERRRLAFDLLSNMEKVIAWSSGAPSSNPSGRPGFIVAQPSVTIQLSDSAKHLAQGGTDYITLPSSPIWSDYGNQDSVDVPFEALQGKDSAHLYFSTVNSMSDNFAPDSASRLGSDGKTTSVERVVVSNIISASVMNEGKTKEIHGLSRSVYITFVHPAKRVQQLSNPQCSWWSPAQKMWSPSGCDLQSHNSTHTTCKCSHLTHFAVLMDVRGHQLSDLDNQLLTFLTYFGCSLSIVCLLITLLCFTVFSRDGGDRVFIHKNLCLMLALAEIVFLFGIWQTQDKLQCSIIAGVLLYLFLSALTWMLLEGYQLYQMLVEVFPSGSHRCLFTFIGYGFPAVITAIAAFYDPTGFGTTDHCWLKTDNLFIMFFIGPAALILVLNTVFLVMTICIVCRHSSGGYLPCRHEADTGRNVRTWVKGSLSISCLLGVTWSLGLLWIDDGHSIYMAYAFTITNSLQGLAIFMFHIVFSEKMRKDISYWLGRRGCCGFSDERNKNGCGALSPSGGSGSGTGSEFLYPSSEKYNSSPRTMDGMMQAVYHPHSIIHPDYQPQNIRHQGTYDYATIAYGDMLPGEAQLYRTPPHLRQLHGQINRNAPDYRQYPPAGVYREQLYGTQMPCSQYHRPPPEFSPPPPPAGFVGPHPQMNTGVPRALLYAAARRPPSSKMSDDSAYSDGGSSMLATEITQNGATVLRMDMSKNPPLFSEEV